MSRGWPPGRHGETVAERLAQSRIEVEAANAAVKLLGASPYPQQPGFVTGECSHPMPGKDWVDGWRVCGSCPQEPLIPDDELPPLPRRPPLGQRRGGTPPPGVQR